jgi:hypothetical protein
MEIVNDKQPIDTVQDSKGNVYTVDVFLKYRVANKDPHVNFKKYFNEQTKSRKNDGLDFLEKQDVRVKLNYVMTKKNVSSEDENLFNMMRYNLNKVNNKMLIPGSENGLQATINSLTSLAYSKIEHFQKLAQMIVDKTVNEQKFCPIYATLCYELAPYYIEIKAKDVKKVYFRHVLINTCQTTFETFLNNCEKIEKDKLCSLLIFLGELYNRKLLTQPIVKGCFDRLGSIIEKSNNLAEGLSALVISTYQSLLKENPETCKYFVEKMNNCIDNNKLHIRSKFAIQNALDKINEIESKTQKKMN